MNLAEAMHYLEKKGIQRNIRELARDIVGGKLHAEQIGERHWVKASDLENAYGVPIQKLNGREYWILRQQGWTKEEIAQKRLLPFYGNEGQARRVAGCYEAHITMKTYDKQHAQENDIQTNSTRLAARDDLVKKLAQAEALGLRDESKKLKEQMKKLIVSCRILQTPYGLDLQIPITPEKQTALGLYKSLNDFFSCKELYIKFCDHGISMKVTQKEGYVTFACMGKTYQTLDILREYIAEKQPEGFAKANLNAQLFIPNELIIKEKEMEKQSERQLEISPEDIYTKGEIVKMYNLGPHPQALGGLTLRKAIIPITVNGGRYYKVIVPPHKLK